MYNSNPILNSPNDITDELIKRIINNDLDSLTINYEFTRWCNEYENADNWKKEQFQANPFWKANNISPLKRIKFEIKFGRNIHSLASAFENLEELEQVNINGISNVTDIRAMFFGAKSFNQPIGNWDISKVTHMNALFCGAKSFNQPIGNWNTSNVINMASVFCGAASFNQPISNWDTSNVTQMACMFCDATSFNQPIGNWNTSRVTDMRDMFNGATSYSYPKPRGAM